MAVIIGGHHRSGTTLLLRLCNSHPDIRITPEFRNFYNLDVSYSRHVRGLRKNWYRSALVPRNVPHSRVRGLLFLIRYLIELLPHRSTLIGAREVEAALRRIFPRVTLVGDKYPEHVFRLDRLSRVPGLFRVIIYRDCRDVARSAVDLSRTRWRGTSLALHMGTVEKVAKRWVHAIEMMERHADRVHVIRYEDLVADPRPVLEALGARLGVDPQGFRRQIVHSRSVGKYRQGLSTQELRDIITIAGPTMERYGYRM